MSVGYCAFLVHSCLSQLLQCLFSVSISVYVTYTNVCVILVPWFSFRDHFFDTKQRARKKTPGRKPVQFSGIIQTRRGEQPVCMQHGYRVNESKTFWTQASAEWPLILSWFQTFNFIKSHFTGNTSESLNTSCVIVEENSSYRDHHSALVRGRRRRCRCLTSQN